MGNSSVQGGIYVAPTNTSVLLGAEIVGKINLEIKYLTKASQIKFVFAGHEYYKSSPSDSKYSKKMKICKREIEIHTWSEGQVPAGQYSSEFYFLIPEDLPESFEYEGIAKIEYTIAAVLTKKNKRIMFDRCKVTLIKPTKMEIGPLYHESKQRIKEFLFNRGECYLRVHLDKNAYSTDDTAYLSIEINNSSSTRSINYLSLALTRSVVFNIGVFGSKIIREDISDLCIYREVPAKAALIDEEAVNVEIPFYLLREKIGKCGTASGKLIQCKYWIELRAHFENGIPDKVLEFEVLILSGGFAPRPVPEIFGEWEPQLMPTSRMSLWGDYQEPSAPSIDDYESLK